MLWHVIARRRQPKLTDVADRGPRDDMAHLVVEAMHLPETMDRAEEFLARRLGGGSRKTWRVVQAHQAREVVVAMVALTYDHMAVEP